MLQWFVHVCYKRLFPMFHLIFQTYDASVFIWMLHMFHTYVASIFLDVAYVLQWFSSVFHMFFLQVFQTHVSKFSSIFCCMLQVLHLDVSKVDRVLHMGCRGKREGRERAPCGSTTQLTSERRKTLHGCTKRRRM